MNCSVHGCERPRSRRGLCVMHYTRAKRAGVLPLEGCLLCEAPASRFRLCESHYDRARTTWQAAGSPGTLVDWTRHLELFVWPTPVGAAVHYRGRLTLITAAAELALAVLPHDPHRAGQLLAEILATADAAPSGTGPYRPLDSP